jgi:tRNA-intron endonuclease
MVIEEIQATFDDGKIIISNQADVETFLQMGYGTAFDDEQDLVLFSWEVLYLLANKRITVIDRLTQEELTFQSLFEKYRIQDGEIWTKYLVYRDLRRRGYVVRAGTGWGITFRVYSRGTYGKKAAKYLIFIACEGKAVLIDTIREVLHLVQGMKKELIVVVMDRRGEIVYYQLTTLNLEKKDFPFS